MNTCTARASTTLAANTTYHVCVCAMKDGTLSFAAEATESTGEVTITAVDNDEDAADGTVTVSGSVSAAPADATLTITDDDEPAVMPPPVERGVEIAPTVLSIGEGDGAGGTYTVRLDAEPMADVTVTVSVPSGAGLAVSPTSLTFTAENWATQRMVTVTAGIDDDADDRTVTLAHSAAGGGYGDVAVAGASVTITDLVDPMLPSVGIADARGREAGGQLVFEVTLSGAAGRPVSVGYATIEGTARAGEDYEAVAGTATIAAGGTGTRIVVPLLPDVISERDETFSVALSGAIGARLGDALATGTIEDPVEDGAVSVPWARVGATGAGEELRLGYSLLTHRGIPSFEFSESAFGREYILGWKFSLRCRVQMAVQLLRTTDSLGEREDTGIELRFRSVARRGASGTGTCDTLQPLFTSGAPR